MFKEMQVRIENIIMIYLIGVLFIIIETKQIMWGITSSFISIITFNYFFTQPLYSLQINDPNYIITIIIFLIVSIITGILVGKMQEHARLSHENEQRTSALYEISKSYLNLSGIDAILMHSIHSLYQYQNIISVVYYHRPEENDLYLYQGKDIPLSDQSDEKMAQWSFTYQCACGHGTDCYNECSWTYYPLQNAHKQLGVYAIYKRHIHDNEEQRFIHTAMSQMVMALEREELYISQEKNRIEIEKEKLRNNLLRSISHDLRTPLTNIAGSSSLILENSEILDTATKLNLIHTINVDAQWLTQLVENLLNMTRIQDGKLLIKKQKEVVDDVILEAIQRCESRKGEHVIEAQLPNDVQLIEMDGRLIVQVLVNYLDNAIKHTQEDSYIDVRYYTDSGKAYFEVCDNGEGIDERIKDQLFESFVTTKQERYDAKRGIGLGLTICKAIITAHGGNVYAHNRKDTHGAVFGFYLPIEKE